MGICSQTLRCRIIIWHFFRFTLHFILDLVIILLLFLGCFTTTLELPDHTQVEEGYSSPRTTHLAGLLKILLE